MFVYEFCMCQTKTRIDLSGDYIFLQLPKLKEKSSNPYTVHTRTTLMCTLEVSICSSTYQHQ